MDGCNENPGAMICRLHLRTVISRYDARVMYYWSFSFLFFFWDINFMRFTGFVQVFQLVFIERIVDQALCVLFGMIGGERYL